VNGYRRNRGCSCARCRCSGFVGPIVLVTLGVLFLIDQYSVYSIGRTWPVILIVIGIVKLVQWNAPTTGHVDVSQIGPGGPPPSGPPTAGPSAGADPQPPSEQVTHG